MRKRSRKTFPQGFTLIEVMVVVTILGVLLAMAMPKFTLVIEHFKVKEQVHLLELIYEAQQSHLRDRGYYYKGAMVAASTLDIDIPLSKNFWAYQFGCGKLEANCPPSSIEDTCACTGPLYGFLAKIVRKNGPWPYTLWKLEDGRTVCKTDTGPACDSTTICAQLGFPVNW